MRTFVSRVLLMGVICISLYGTLFLAVFVAERAAYFKEVRIPEGVRVAACGDSQLTRALESHDWPGSFNWCLSALRLDQLELKVYGLLKENPGYRGAVVVDISPSKLHEHGFDTPLSQAGAAGKRVLLHVLYPERNVRPLGDMFRLFKDALVRRRTGKAISAVLRGKKYKCSIGGEALDYVPPERDAVHTVQGFLVAPAGRARGVAAVGNRINSTPFLSADSDSLRIVRRILTDIRERGCTPVLVTTPYHPDLVRKIDPARLAAFRQLLRKLTDELGVRWYDYLEHPMPTECWIDCVHLNRTGARLFTKRLREDIEHDL